MKYVVYGKRAGATWFEVTHVEATNKEQATEKVVRDSSSFGPFEHVLTVTMEVYNTACDEAEGFPSVDRLRELSTRRP